MKQILFFILLGAILFSCSDKNDFAPHNFKNTPPEVDFTYFDNIDEFAFAAQATDIDGDELTYYWKSNSESILFSNTKSASTKFPLPDFEENKNIVVTLLVSDGIDTVESSKTIEVPTLTQSRIWGLGVIITKEVSNNVNYDWYIDQGNTGVHSDFNCGPASVTMVAKWVYPDFSATCQDARNKYHPDGGWWYSSDIIGYLNSVNVKNQIIPITTINVLKEQLDSGNIMIINPDMYYIRVANKPTHHVDRFYNANEPRWGHFIVVKGYKIVDELVFYEVYDPYGFGKKYSNGPLMGIDRYYRAEDIDKTTNIWWDFAFVIYKNK